MHSAWVRDIRPRVRCIELSLQHSSSPQDTCSIPRVYAVMRGGAISFSFHRRCGIYVLLIHSDIFFFFLCVQRSEYADSFFEQDRGSGAMADTRFGRKIQPGAPGAEVWRFSLPTAGTDLGVAQAPSYLCEGKETASVAYASSGAAG